MCDVKVRGCRVWVALLEDALFYVIWTLWQPNVELVSTVFADAFSPECLVMYECSHII